MAAANAQIGVARAAYYPNITLGPSLGVDSRNLSSLFDASSLLWSLGVSIAQPLFDAGRADGNVAIAQASYQQTVANYRRVVLTAMQEVEDGISGSAALDRALAQAAGVGFPGEGAGRRLVSRRAADGSARELR